MAFRKRTVRCRRQISANTIINYSDNKVVTILGDYQPGTWYENGWGIGFLFFGYAALQMLLQPQNANDSEDHLENIAPPNSPLGDVVRITRADGLGRLDELITAIQ